MKAPCNVDRTKPLNEPKWTKSIQITAKWVCSHAVTMASPPLTTTEQQMPANFTSFSPRRREPCTQQQGLPVANFLNRDANHYLLHCSSPQGHAVLSRTCARVWTEAWPGSAPSSTPQRRWTPGAPRLAHQPAVTCAPVVHSRRQC